MKNQKGLLYNESLSEKVLLWFQQELAEGNFRPGSELPSERVLCETLGVGKSSIREALKMLQMAGVVEICQGKRTRICQNLNFGIMLPIMFNMISQTTSMRELYDFRIMFDKSTTEMAMQRATDEDITRLEQELNRFEALVKTDSATVEDDLEFHKIILDICKNDFVKEIGNIVFQIFVHPLKHIESYNAKKGLDDHKKILSAFKTKDKKNIELVMDQVFEYSNTI